MSIMLKSTNSTNTIDKTERVLAHPLRTVDYRFPTSYSKQRRKHIPTI